MPLKINHPFKILYLLVVLFLWSCNTTKNISDGEYLLKSNSIHVEDIENASEYEKVLKVEKKRLATDLSGLALQVPNKKFLYIFQPRLFFYNATHNPKKEQKREAKGKSSYNKFNGWIREKLAETPVVFDSTLLISSEEKMTNYLINQGYFNADVSSEFKLHKKKAEVFYKAFPAKRYSFNETFFEIEDPDIDKVVKANMAKSFIKKGDPYTTDALKLEQERIALALNNNGFFSFTKNNILFEVDTSGDQTAKNVYLQIKMIKID